MAAPFQKPRFDRLLGDADRRHGKTSPTAAANMRPSANWEAGLRMMNDHRVGLAIVVRNCVDCDFSLAKRIVGQFCNLLAL